VDQESFATDDFPNRVDDWVLRGIAEGCRTFGDLIYRLPGVYPTVAVEGLHRLAARGAVPMLEAMGMAAQARRPAGTDIASLAADGLPVPHPLDFDWRFTDDAVTSLLAEAHLLSRHRGALGVVGAPSVALRAGRELGARGVIVYDMNQSVLSALRRSGANVFGCRGDILGAMPPPARLDVVVTDPPWYLDELCGALRFCRAICRVGGFILASIPPLGTRPGIQAEREQLISSAASLGLDLVRIDPARLPYRSPPFEQNALRAAGVVGAPVDWRKGDLAVFARTRASEPPNPPAPLGRYEAWSEMAFSAARIRIRAGRGLGFSDPRLIPLVDDDVLPTVSRRDPRRAAAVIWTSGNRVFGCRGGDILLTVAKALASGRDPLAEVECRIGRLLSPMESMMAGEAAVQLERVLMREIAELWAYAGESRRSTTRVFAS
jgi:hypothetical protein